MPFWYSTTLRSRSGRALVHATATTHAIAHGRVRMAGWWPRRAIRLQGATPGGRERVPARPGPHDREAAPGAGVAELDPEVIGRQDAEPVGPFDEHDAVG